ncbi:acyltransferase [Mucilaginibacter sp.]|uniref:acyltransferase family protein n=1 Tax=Mucilaginibacter sp. TaxID=1882438 RepID=UPI002618BC9B|nr:acyltransferase [Mucilaginibacter sp.]MDB4926769.1 Acyltransferase family protein [Mucilaginibacter sp.]
MLKDNKIVSIQYLRGLAALGVVFCHYGLFNAGQLGVFVFFFISGFIIVYSLAKSDYKPRQFLKFLLKRSIRIDPAYFGAILLTCLFFITLSYIPSFRGKPFVFIPNQLIAHVFYIVPFTKYQFYNSVFWTLCVEFQFYLIIGILYFISNSPLYKIIFLLAFSSTCFIPFSNSYFLVFTYAPIFALGISLIDFYQVRRPVYIVLPILLIGLVLYKFGLTISILLVISSLIVLYFKLVIKQLSFLGDISYSLYLIHPLVLFTILGILKKLHINITTNRYLWVFCEIVIAICVAYLFYILIEKPSQKLSKRINIKG